jgi:hypothetical protein
MPILGIDMYKGCISTASPYTALGPDVDTLLISRHSPDLGHVVEKRSEATTHILVLITRHLQLGQEFILFVDSCRRGKEWQRLISIQLNPPQRIVSLD